MRAAVEGAAAREEERSGERLGGGGAQVDTGLAMGPWVGRGTHGRQGTLSPHKQSTGCTGRPLSSHMMARGLRWAGAKDITVDTLAMPRAAS